MNIKSITIVTAQGVNIFDAVDDTIIVQSDYRIAGDPYECFKVVKCGQVIREIRCVHNIEIEYFQEQVEKEQIAKDLKRIT